VRKIRTADRYLSFWSLQTAGWLAYAVVMTLSLVPLRHQRGLIPSYLVLIGDEFLASFFLYRLCHTLWRRSVALVPSLALCMAASYVLATASAVPAVWIQMRAQPNATASVWSAAIASGVGAAFVLIAWCALYFGIKHYLTVGDQKLLLLASEATAQAAQLQALRYQLQPHFLFNTLNAISSLVVSEQGAQATQMLSKLATLLRSTLEQPDVHSISLDQELAVVDEYLDIEKVRFASRMTVTHDIEWGARSAAVPRFLLQPIVENAIRHGIAKRPKGGALNIRAFLIDNQVIIEVKNEIGESHSDGAQTNHGLGLSNSRTRLEKLYGDRATLKIVTEQQQFIVTIAVPFEPIGAIPSTKGPA
jgi:Histidine kinase